MIFRLFLVTGTITLFDFFPCKKENPSYAEAILSATTESAVSGTLKFYELKDKIVEIDLEVLIPSSKILKPTSILYLSGSVTSMLLFTILGRDEGANRVASFVANLILTGEGVCWILLGLVMFNLQQQVAKKSLCSAP